MHVQAARVGKRRLLTASTPPSIPPSLSVVKTQYVVPSGISGPAVLQWTCVAMQSCIVDGCRDPSVCGDYANGEPRVSLADWGPVEWPCFACLVARQRAGRHAAAANEPLIEGGAAGGSWMDGPPPHQPPGALPPPKHADPRTCLHLLALSHRQEPHIEDRPWVLRA